MKDINLEAGKIEIQTIDDNFEKLPIGNFHRFNQFIAIMAQNPKANEMSIRVLVD